MVLIFVKNTILQAIFEIATKFNIYWRKLMWNCETGGRNSPATLRKITNIWSGWIFLRIFFPVRKRTGSHFFVFMLLNWIQRLDYQGDFEINISAIKNSLKKIYIFFFLQMWNYFQFHETSLQFHFQFHFFDDIFCRQNTSFWAVFWKKWGFIILASFIHETTTSFIFGGKKTENIQTVSCSFTWNWPQKKWGFYLKPIG